MAIQAHSPLEDLVVERRFTSSTSTDTVREGHILTPDLSQTDDPDRWSWVAQAGPRNLLDSRAFLVAPGTGETGVNQKVSLIPLDCRDIEVVTVRTDQSITPGDLLSVHPGTYFARKGVLNGSVALKALETKDGSSATNGVTLKCRLYTGFRARQQIRGSQVFYDHDFCSVYAGADPVSVGGWDTVGDAGFDIAPAAGGGAAFNSDATDNDAAYLQGPRFTYASTRPALAYFKFDLTEANTDDSNIAFGFILNTELASDVPITDTGAAATNYDGAMFHKIEGTGLAWSTETSDATTQETNTAVATFTSGSTYEGWIYMNNGSIYFWLAEDGADPTLEATHSTTVPGGVLSAFIGVKNGGANAETINVRRALVAASA